MSLDDCLSDPEVFARLLQEMADRRNAAPMRPPEVEAWHARLIACTGGAIDDAAQIGAPLRELRRYLCTMAQDARLIDLASRMLTLSCPPDLRRPPRDDLPPAGDDERVRWRNLRAMVLEARGDLTAARNAFAEAIEDYARLPHPEVGRFAILTNAVMSAYELGDDLRGARYLALAERIAAQNSEHDAVRLNIALARPFPAAFAGETEAFTAAHALSRETIAELAPGLLPAWERFGALRYAQMGARDLALAALPPLPPDEAPPLDLSPDTLVRLQVQLAFGPADPALVERALGLMGREESIAEDWALCGVLAEALFAQGEIAPAMICAVLFLRGLDSTLETLPQRAGVSMELRRSILAIFTPLQRVLVNANYLAAAERLSALHGALLNGRSLRKGAYADWAPDARLADLATQARAVQAEARAGIIPPEAFARFLRAQSFTPAPEALPAPLSGTLRIAFLPYDGKLLRVVHSGPARTAEPLAPSLAEIADLAQRLHRKLPRGLGANAERTALGTALFSGLEADLAGAEVLDILPFGPVAALPLAALEVQGAALGTTHRLRIHTGQALGGAASAPGPASVPLRVAFALGTGPDMLERPREEAAQILRLHGQPTAALAEFNRASLEAMLAERPRFLHIGAHFDMRAGDLDRSALIAAKGEAIPLSAVFNRTLDLRGTELVFLAGCDSAGHAGTESFAAQLVGLGARHVIAALWPVEDAAAQALAVATHTALARGATPAEALAEAQASLRANPAFAAPRHWAAFQCYSA